MSKRGLAPQDACPMIQVWLAVITGEPSSAGAGPTPKAP